MRSVGYYHRLGSGLLSVWNIGGGRFGINAEDDPDPVPSNLYFVNRTSTLLSNWEGELRAVGP